MVASMQVTAPEQIGFDPGSDIDVRQVGDSEWMTLRPVVYRGQTETFVVPANFCTDFASVPRPFVWFLPRYGRYTRAAILHDYLCEHVEDGVISRADADGVFRQAMRTLSVPFLRRWIMWGAVRLGALGKPSGRKGWLGQSWRVVPVGLVALPIVLPAAAVIMVTLPVFYLTELIAWLALAVGKRVRQRAGQPTKQVNRPRLSTTL